jgi:hypothetical protein
LIHELNVIRSISPISQSIKITKSQNRLR